MAINRLIDSRRWAHYVVLALMIALLAAFIAFWFMQLLAPAVTIAPTGSLVSRTSAPNTSAAAPLFGLRSGASPVAQTILPSNIKVIGLAAAQGDSAVIVTVDGKSPQVFAVGDPINDSLTVASVSLFEVVIDRSGEEIRVPAPGSNDVSILFGQTEQTSDSDSALQTPVSTRPSIPPRALPPSGAAAASNAARNTTGVASATTVGQNTNGSSAGRKPARPLRAPRGRPAQNPAPRG